MLIYGVEWSNEDKEWVGTCNKYPPILLKFITKFLLILKNKSFKAYRQ